MTGLPASSQPLARLAVDGFSIVELLVAAACTSLIAAAILSLLVGSTNSGRQLIAEAEIRALARAAAVTLAEELEGVGRGAEGVWLVAEHGEQVPVIQPVVGGLVRLLVPMSDSVEVEPIHGSSRYRVGTRGGLAPGVTVLGLGWSGAGTRVGPGGRVRSLVPPGRGRLPRPGVVEIQWAGREAAAIQAGGEVRALLPAVWREYALVRRDQGMQLRRRDASGRWQPVVDGLLGVSIDYLVDRDGDGRPDGGLSPDPEPSALILGARVRAQAGLGEWQPVVVERWARVGG